MRQCASCFYKANAAGVDPCNDCMEIRNKGTKWARRAKPSDPTDLEILQMRIEHLEMLICEMIQDAPCRCVALSKAKERKLICK